MIRIEIIFTGLLTDCVIGRDRLPYLMAISSLLPLVPASLYLSDLTTVSPFATTPNCADSVRCFLCSCGLYISPIQFNEPTQSPL